VNNKSANKDLLMLKIALAVALVVLPNVAQANESKTDVIGKIIRDFYAERAQAQQAAKAAQIAAQDVRLAERKLAIK
jgi:hypothetical protein